MPVPGWRVVLRLPTHQDSPLLASVTSADGADAWATGAATALHGRRFSPLIEHWDGSAWQPVTLPPPAARRWQHAFPLSAVAAVPGDFWAVSEALGSYLHWNGRSWSAGQLPGGSPASPLVISSVQEFSRTDVWVFGGHLTSARNGTTDAPYVARFNGRRWQQVRSPAGPTAISAVSALSPDDIWAVLGRMPLLSSGKTLQRNALVHWNGRRWAPVALPKSLLGSAEPRPGSSAAAVPSPAASAGAGHGTSAAGTAAPAPVASLTSILALAPDDVWIGGGIPNGRHGLTEMAAHWAGGRWRVIMLPAYLSPVQYQLTSLVPDGTGGAWAVATNAGLTRSRLWHLHAGRWHGPTLLAPCRHSCVLPGLARVPGTSSVWAAGAAAHGSTGDGLVALTGRSPS